MRQTHRVSVLCIILSFFVWNPMAYAESDAKFPDLGSGQIGGCTDEACYEEIFRSDETRKVCIRIDARNGGLPSLKVAKGNSGGEVVAEWNDLVARTTCVRGSSVVLQCSPSGFDAVCLYRIVHID